MVSGVVHRNALPTGSRINEYVIEGILGEPGGFGIAYLARDVNLDQQVAIKEYLPNDLAMREGTTVQPKSTHDEEDYQWGLERFLDEAKTLAKFPHSNIVQVLRYFEANSTGYMVMRYEDGLPLNEILKKETLTEEELTQNILFPLLDGLKKVHAGGFLHRDIKPSNIYMRRADETPVLLDFGAARNALGSKSKSLTSIVTAGYAPFEQYHSDGNQGAWSDIYALGAVAYRIVTGKKPPEAPSRIKKDKMIPTIEAAKGKYSEQLLKAIDHALEMNEEDRPQSCDEWKRELIAQPISETPPVPEPRSNKKKVRWKVVLLSFLLPILGLFIVLFVIKQVHDQEEKAAFEKKITDIRAAGIKVAADKEKQRLAEEHAKKLAEKEAIEKASKITAGKGVNCSSTSRNFQEISGRDAKLSKPYGWPSEGGWISSRFGPRIDPFTGESSQHNGIDITNRKGAPVIAANSGVVTFVGQIKNFDYVLEIDHGNGYKTRYAKMSDVSVHECDVVKYKQLLGHIGSNRRGAYLHYEVHHFGELINPHPFLPNG